MKSLKPRSLRSLDHLVAEVLSGKISYMSDISPSTNIYGAIRNAFIVPPCVVVIPIHKWTELLRYRSYSVLCTHEVHRDLDADCIPFPGFCVVPVDTP